jgi:uncharacterized FAD-dependent dehydrogenase
MVDQMHTNRRNFKAAQQMIDFVNRKQSKYFLLNSYLPGLTSANLQILLPPFIYHAQRHLNTGKKRRIFTNGGAVIVAVESRTSSPVRIP